MPKVAVAPERVTVRPGEATEVEVTIQNTSRAVEHYDTTIVGLPRDDLYGCEPSTVKLRPGESGTVLVNLSIPERPAPDAGLYTLGVLVRSPYQRRVSRCAELRLDVQPAPGISVEAQPEVATGGGTGAYGLRLANDGNTALDITLQGSDPEGRVTFYFRPRSVRVAPNATAPAQLTVRAAAPWSGQELRRTLTVRATAGADLSSEKLLTFVQRPRIPAGPMRFVGIAIAVAILAAATLAGALMRNKADKTAPDQNKVGAAASGLPPGPPIAIQGQTPQTPASSPAAAAPPAKPPTLAAPVPGVPLIVDFSQPPDGKTNPNRPIAGDLWAKSGVTLSTVVTQQTPPACKAATGLALRTFTGLGSFITSADESGTATCNQLPIKIMFSVSVRSLALTYLSHKGGGYQLLVEQADGKVTAIQQTPLAGTVGNMEVPAPANTTIVSVQFGHSSTDPNSADATLIKRLIFVPATG